ncbi:hypothetical protein SELMODRAFT_92604 [Selaginella moellendorffii]|uniref:PRISE-like Rossmann-fold domain-containing protein n=1 Tax=Selaginella moellendorffii TaxID=88036 RepID=D8RF33_SELML|nr:3-oxo-Delta(4,5)-steroid 5-beta-reductase [Selaginella moellendorffii]EFJ28801.1 hypothetical protein SELMODRAFT_92604 [Selaginella moellendorffii]|eukprot:XP_002969677.1 3-oxo-Delta(4,5)-steroid 5-beta-reductase [Selaginella moellendorffii]
MCSLLPLCCSRTESPEAASEHDGHNEALIVGVTGIVGNSLVEALQRPDAPGAPWRIRGIARRPKPRWFEHPDVDYIQCNLLNLSEVTPKLSSLGGVTHVFWVAWEKQSTEEENCEANGFMLRSVLQALLPVAKRLKHVCLQTGVKHYLGPYFHFGTIKHYRPPFHEDLPRVPGLPNFYYTLEDILFEACSPSSGITWSVHRPNIIFGFAPRNHANVLGSLAIYAAICKHQKLSFNFPGNRQSWETLTNVSDADLVAEQELWAATNPSAKNEAFNIADGDCTSWERLWAVMAREFKLECPAYDGKPVSLEQLLKNKKNVWEQIVVENGLLETAVQDETWWAVDLCLNFPFQVVSCMNKSKEHGFLSYRNSEKSVIYWIRKMKEKNILPDDKFWTS